MDLKQLDMILNETTVTAVQKLINKAISNSPDALSQLQVMEGKSCGLILEDIGRMFVFRIAGEQLLISVGETEKQEAALCTALLGATIPTLLKALLAEDIRHVLTDESVKLQGQTYIFVALHQIVKSVGLHWQQEIESLFGSLLATPLIDYCKTLYEQVRTTNKHDAPPAMDSFDPSSSKQCMMIMDGLRSISTKIKSVEARYMIAEFEAKKKA